MTADHPRRRLGHGVDPDHHDAADTAPPRRPGRTVAELAALLAVPPAAPAAPRSTGRRPLTTPAAEED
ncbi:hypothetical protein [Kitasatospora sp. NPDC059673]|uniref:hypothetical protein n=1 Tax=Kitasatospora sp. NPDC059673 TaxID=3346901 RepID=UPI0036CA5BE1